MFFCSPREPFVLPNKPIAKWPNNNNNPCQDTYHSKLWFLQIITLVTTVLVFPKDHMVKFDPQWKMENYIKIPKLGYTRSTGVFLSGVKYIIDENYIYDIEYWWSNRVWLKQTMSAKGVNFPG